MLYNDLMRIFYGIIAVIVGTVLLKYNFKLANYTGRQDWIESKLGAGSTYFVYKLLAIVVVLGGLLAVTGLGGSVLNWVLSPFQHLLNLNQ